MHSYSPQDKPLRRKPGPIPSTTTRKCHLVLEADLADWGKRQPGGLSALMRRLLTAEYQRQHTKDKSAA